MRPEAMGLLFLIGLAFASVVLPGQAGAQAEKAGELQRLHVQGVPTRRCSPVPAIACDVSAAQCVARAERRG